MELSVKIAWILLALIHIGPALTALFPSMVEKLYDVPANGETSVLLVHRGVLFAAVVSVATYAVLDPSVRQMASIVLGLSMSGFLIHYIRVGAPTGGLRKIAIVDAIGLLPLSWVLFDAWN